MQFYPSVDMLHLTYKNTEQDLQSCFQWIRDCIDQKFKVTILVKKKPDIDDKVEMALEKFKKQKWENREKTPQEIEAELREIINGKIKESKDKKKSDPQRSLKLLLESKEIYENQITFIDLELRINLYSQILTLYQTLNIDDQRYYNLQDLCIEIIQTSSNEIKNKFAQLSKDLLINKIRYIVTNAQKLQNDPQSALEYYNKAFALNETLNDQKVNSVKILIRIAQQYQCIGKEEDTFYYWQKALQRLETIENQESVIEDKKYLLYNIGQGYYERQNEDLTLSYWQRTIELLEEQDKSGQLETQDKQQLSQLLSYVGTLYYQKKDLKKSILYLEKTVNIMVDLYGPDNINVANKQHNLGEAYRNDKQYEKALEMFSRALNTKKREFSINPNKSYASTLNNIALTFQNLKNYDMAVRKFSETLNYLEQPGVYQSLTNGDGALAKSLTCHQLAECYKALHEIDGAAKYFSEAFEIRKNELGHRNKLTQGSATQLAAAYFQLNNYQQANDLFEWILEVQIELYGKDNYVVGQTMNNLSSILTQLGRYQEAFNYIEQAQVTFQEKLQPNDPLLTKIKENKLIIQKKLEM